MFQTDLLSGGESHAASHQASFECHNPATGAVATRAAASLEDVDKAIAAAEQAFPAWSAMLPGARRALLLKAADRMEQHRAEFVERGVAEAGGSPIWYHFNVTLAGNMLREAASMTTQISGEVIPSDVPGSLATGVRQACGVVVGIAPPKVVERLIAHPAVRRINFTGSTAVGRIIAQHAATHLKPVLLELGGKNPVVVLDDAAVEAAAFSAFFNQGQICMSADRILVDRKVAPAFLEKLAAKTATLKAAPADAPLAGMVAPAAAQKVAAMLRDAIERGANVTQASPGVEGNIMQPAIVDGVTPEMAVYQHESFGFKGSGYGRFGGKAAIAELPDLRWITIQTTPRHFPI